MRDVKQTLQSALSGASWPRFVTLLFVLIVCAGYGTIDTVASLGRLMTAASAIVPVAFAAEVLHERVLVTIRLPALRRCRPKLRFRS